MNTEKAMRQEVKNYMLEVDAENDSWDMMPDKVKADVEAALIESDKGQVIPHAEIQKRYKKWIAK